LSSARVAWGLYLSHARAEIKSSPTSRRSATKALIYGVGTTYYIKLMSFATKPLQLCISRRPPWRYPSSTTCLSFTISSKAVLQVLNPRSALLSNYEVLTLLKELENDHLERSKTAMRIKKEEESLNSSTSIGATSGTHPHHHNTNYLPDISENLRTIQVEVRFLLTLTTPRQTVKSRNNRRSSTSHPTTFQRIHKPQPEYRNSPKILRRTILPKLKNSKS
jgi:hypothetical protein